jgi:hypothetical protein
MKPGEGVCTDEKGKVLVTIDPDLKPIPRHDMNLILTGICSLCDQVDEDRLDELMKGLF